MFLLPRDGVQDEGDGLDPALGSSGEAGEVGGCEEGRPKNVVTRRISGSLASDKGFPVEQPAHIFEFHGERKGCVNNCSSTA